MERVNVQAMSIDRKLQQETIKLFIITILPPITYMI